MQLDWSKTGKQYYYGKIYLSVSGKQAKRAASSWPEVFLSQVFRYFPAF